MRSRLPALLVLLLVLVTPSTHPQDSKLQPRKLSAAAERWVEHTLKHMTTNEKIGQIVFPTYFGAFYSTESEDYRELMRRVERDHIGGFILATRTGPRGIERSTVYSTAQLTNQIQRKAKIPLLIAADFEHGTVMRIVEGTSFPEPMAVAATGRPEDARAIGRITAIEARAVGVHWIFAPVADVNSNPDNPIINIRSFGEDPHKVAEFVSAFISGVEENGALATAKHFPGHGDTGTDSHLDLPLVSSDRARLDAVNLVPFRAAVAAGVSSIMTGHLAVPAIEPDPELPATLSEKVLTTLLRKEMGFDGLVVTDALDMGGVTNHYAPAEVAVRALNAGADVLLMPPVPDAALLALKDAVKSGRIPIARLDDAVRRVLRAKARLGLDKQRFVDVDKLNSVFAQPEFARVAQDIADRGVTLLRNDANLIPLDARKPLRTLLVSISADPDTIPGNDFVRAVKSELDSVDLVRVDTRYFRPATVTIPSVAGYDLVLIALSVRVADSKGTVGIPPDQAEIVHRLLASGKPTIVASFGSPYLIQGFPEATTWLSVFDSADVGQRAIARALLGDVAIGGKLPVRLPLDQPHTLSVGDGLTTVADPMTLRPASAEMKFGLEKVRDILSEASIFTTIISDSSLTAYPRPVVETRRSATSPDNTPAGIITLGSWLFVAHKSQREAFFVGEPLSSRDNETSLLYLPTAIAILVAAKQLSLDTPIFRILPDWAIGSDAQRRKRVTVRELLAHTSGLAGDQRPIETVQLSNALLEQTFATPLAADPGATFSYSTKNLILLSEIVNRLTGVALPEFIGERIDSSLSVCQTPGTPLTSSGGECLTALGQLWLDGGIFAHRRLFYRLLHEQMTTRHVMGASAFAEGWETPSDSSGTGRYFSPGAYGLSGPTSLWIDPQKELVVVIHLKPFASTVDLTKLNDLRSALHDAVIEGLGIAPPH